MFALNMLKVSYKKSKNLIFDFFENKLLRLISIDKTKYI